MTRQALVLVGERGEFRVAAEAWTLLLHLATRYEWTPQGTIRGDGWSGSYMPPRGQMIRARDAAGLALALDDLLDDLPDAEVPNRAASANSLERLGGSAKPAVVRLVEFLRGGAVNVFATCGCRGAACDLA